jgi:pimeloyl-ACP methyl ester carboxylesterase
MRSLHLPAHDAFIRWHETGGDGATVVCLPGLCFPAVGSFLRVATHRALRDLRWVMVDGLGSGVSDHPAAPLTTLDAHADSVAAALDHLGGAPATVVGHSMGGSVGIALARRRPDLVARLIVAEANLTPGGGAATRKIAASSREDFVTEAFPAMLARCRSAAMAGDARAAFLYGAWRQADPRALHANAAMLVDLPDGFAEGFFALSIPRSFLYGARSHPAATGAATPDAPDPVWLEAHGVATATVPDCGHDLPLENPEGFAQALIAAGVS